MNQPMSESRNGREWLLGAVAAGVACWCYAQSIAPHLQSERDARCAITVLQERVKTARGAIEEFRLLERDAQVVRREIDGLGQALPAGPATTWMPDLLKQHFARFGLHASVVRMNTVRDEPDLPGFCRGYWSVGLPLAETGRGAAGSLLAVAEFEQQHGFVKVLDFAIRPDPENPQGRIALLNVAALVRK